MPLARLFHLLELFLRRLVGSLEHSLDEIVRSHRATGKQHECDKSNCQDVPRCPPHTSLQMKLSAGHSSTVSVSPAVWPFRDPACADLRRSLASISSWLLPRARRRED